MPQKNQHRANVITRQIDLYYAAAPPGKNDSFIRQKHKLYIAYSLLPSSLPLVYCLVPTLAQAQPIVPANDTNTLVQQQGNSIQIQGGRRVGGNLFHSFRQFGVHAGQTVNFNSTETIRNILARVVSGEPSIINGIIKVTGGASNLYLINPSGIVFGADARLDVPASFLATTANHVEFNGNWFNAIGANNYDKLVEDPTAFAFSKSESGVIINEGNLAVPSGESLTLLGGTVISLGTLEAPGGQINLVAVPDEEVVRVTQNGHLLSLEIANSRWNQTSKNSTPTQITPLSFPKMLTGGNRNHAQGVTINSEGKIVLSNSNQTIEPQAGTVIVSGDINTSASVDLKTQPTPQLQPGGNIEISGDHIVLSSAKIQTTPQPQSGIIERQNNPDFGLGKVKLTSWSNSVEISHDSMILAEEITVNHQPVDSAVASHGVETQNNPIDPISSSSNSDVIQYRLANLKLNRYKAAAEQNIPNFEPSQTQQAVAKPQVNYSHLNQIIQELELVRTQTFNPQLDINHSNNLSLSSIQNSLKKTAQSIQKNPGIIYVVSREQQLELILITANRSPQYYRIPEANQQAFNQQIRHLVSEVSRPPETDNSEQYLTASQQLYQWMIAPLETELEKQGIDTLIFSLDPGIRNFPIATLHDGESFLVQKYSLGLIPSLNLTDIRYQNINNLSVLAMGASEFRDDNIVDLPAVETELSMILADWRGQTLLNQDFTLENLQSQQEKQSFEILHLATHGAFNPRQPEESYLQLWDQKLHFDELRQLNSTDQPLELLVLSACETAFGDAEAELGLAGLAVQTGVKSVLASLWQVDDAATLGLMSEFYRQLSQMRYTVKAEALRQAQIAMIEGDVRVEAGQLRSLSRGDRPVNLPVLAAEGNVSLSHPYYWASFVMVGSPW
ncbi:MAG: CHAT domain-containing protein [Microcoleaceae cyanobacterium]